MPAASFRCADGNVADVATHIDTWSTLCTIAGRADFLYVIDSKLCSRQNMDHIARHGGRFVTVMPRNRQEDGQFRHWLQTHTPAWEPVWQRPNPPSAELYPIVWVWSTLLTLKHGFRRQNNVAAAIDHLGEIKRRLGAARARLRGAAQIDLEVDDVLAKRSGEVCSSGEGHPEAPRGFGARPYAWKLGR